MKSTRSTPQKPDVSNATDASDTTDTSTSGNDTDVQDDTLTRLKTKDTLAAGQMGRDEGQLTRKTQRRERISEVESTKQLKTSGVDPKFQGSLLHSSVTSIEDISEKADNSKAASGEMQAVQEGGPRFDEKHLVFSQEQGNESKKKEQSHNRAESSPSPTSTPNRSTDGSKR